jgi:phage terminase large subunit-like protein
MYFMDGTREKEELFKRQRAAVLGSFKAFVMTFAPIADKTIPSRVVTNYSMRTVIRAIEHGLNGLIHTLQFKHAKLGADGEFLYSDDGETLIDFDARDGCVYCKKPTMDKVFDGNGNAVGLSLDCDNPCRVHIMNISAPQRSLKSVINACAIMYLWAHVPQAKIIYLTDNDKVRLNHNVYCNNIFGSQLYYRYTGLKRPQYATNNQINKAVEDGDEINPDAFSNEYTTSNDRGGTRSTYKFTTGSIGTTYNMILFDDIINIKDAMSGDFSLKMERYQADLDGWLTRHSTYDTCFKLCNQQRYSINDPFVWLDKRGAMPIVIPYEKTEKNYDNFIVQDSRSLGEPAVPHSLITPQQIDEIKIATPRAYYANMQQDPVPNEGNVFGEECFVYDDIFEPCYQHTIAFDTASKALKTSAQTAAVILGRVGNHIVIRDFFVGNLKLDEILEKFNECAIIYKGLNRDVVIEDESTGSALKDLLIRSGVREAHITMAKTLGLSKKMRAEEVEPQVRNGVVRFHADMNPSKKELMIKAMMSFNGTGKDVDLIDALVHGIKKLTVKKGTSFVR